MVERKLRQAGKGNTIRLPWRQTSAGEPAKTAGGAATFQATRGCHASISGEFPHFYAGTIIAINHGMLFKEA